MAETRGIRNNNPFNIKRSSSRWFGKVPFKDSTDKTFEQFISMDFGLRAGIVLLVGYLKHGFNTPAKIINRFAPSCENNVRNYLSYIHGFTGISPNTVIISFDMFYQFSLAICVYESKYYFSIDRFATILHKYNINIKFDSKLWKKKQNKKVQHLL